MKTSLILPYIFEGPSVHEMSDLWNLHSRIRTIHCHHWNWVPDIRYWLWRHSNFESNTDDMAQHSSPHCNMWALMSMASVPYTLIPHQGTFFVQGFYAYRISVLGKSKKVAAAIIIVSCRKSFFCIQNLNSIKIFFARYKALFHSTWWRDSGWGLWKAEEIL